MQTHIAIATQANTDSAIFSSFVSVATYDQYFFFSFLVNDALLFPVKKNWCCTWLRKIHNATNHKYI